MSDRLSDVQFWNGLEEVPRGLGPTAVTIGNFDGVHLGHQQVLARLVAAAHGQAAADTGAETGAGAETGEQADDAAAAAPGEVPSRTQSPTQAHTQPRAQAVAITFDPHPLQVHRPEESPVMLTGTAEKVQRLTETGIDALLVLHYNLDLAGLTAEEFVKTYFVDTLHASVVVIGHDVRFGRGNSGNFETMVELGRRYGFTVLGVDDFALSGRSVAETERRCSSTWVREALEAGDVAAAAEVLGRPHAVLGEVVHGAARGRGLGFPTANLGGDSEGMIPADGVYAGWLVDAAGARWPAAISVGSNPTFHGVERVVESHVIDRPTEEVEDFDLYGQHVRVEFVQRLRGMVAYEGVPKLVEQMYQDVEQTREVLSRLPAE
ncbi:bifunctional riboflavin kinase/FAD synthetase [Nesterenkonia jeotgali]|uniref:Bifunctional riboflavin kinase/FMN adenylyltransferase n=1 Tax=Nesterenkonia jeotgali TaxID=317018 RepID=A0A0W8IFQ9_9MICC|nr:bifunctional riboflavin kinase/FAD synthetase [Nesterenkonia jeotgali]KUG58850.1 bifunctional riboflavin kinase/FMN adenylyltransferase [Nesterenkonia jeotgali]